MPQVVCDSSLVLKLPMPNSELSGKAQNPPQPVTLPDNRDVPVGNIYLDFTLSSGLRGPATGVIRTERRLTRYLLGRHAEGVRFIVWHHTNFRLVPENKVLAWSADPEDAPIPALTPSDEAQVKMAIPGNFSRTERQLGERLGLLVKRVDQATTVHLWRAGVRIWKLFFPPPLPPSHLDELPICQIQPGDIYVNCAMILEKKRRVAVEKLRARGVKVVIFAYDLIAVLHPEYYEPRLGGILSDCFHRMIRLADFIPCISRCTERDFQAFARRKGCSISTGVVELGCDGVATAAPEHGSHPVLTRLEEFNFVAMVGTFEIRKNHRLIIKLWEKLSAELGEKLPPLVIAGMRGWRVDGVIDEMRKLPIYGSKIFWLESLSDRQVAWLFKHCAFSVYPSLYEGWGLPVAECLSFSRPVLCSNTSSLPEVAKGLATLIDPRDPAAWERAVRSAIAEYVGRPVSINYPRQTWEHAGRDIFDQILRMRSSNSPSARA